MPTVASVAAAHAGNPGYISLEPFKDFLSPQRMMKTIKDPLTHEREPVAVPNDTEHLKTQVLTKIGRPPRLHRVEISRHHGGNYRVNIWQHPEPSKDLAVTLNPRIKWSYYLTVSDAGEILHSDPPMTKLDSAV